MKLLKNLIISITIVAAPAHATVMQTIKNNKKGCMVACAVSTVINCAYACYLMNNTPEVDKYLDAIALKARKKKDINYIVNQPSISTMPHFDQLKQAIKNYSKNPDAYDQKKFKNTPIKKAINKIKETTKFRINLCTKAWILSALAGIACAFI